MLERALLFCPFGTGSFMNIFEKEPSNIRKFPQRKALRGKEIRYCCSNYFERLSAKCLGWCKPSLSAFLSS